MQWLELNPWNAREMWSWPVDVAVVEALEKSLAK